MEEKVRSNDHHDELREGVERCLIEEKCLDGDSIGCNDSSRDFFPFTTPFGKLEFLVSIGGIVEPLPGTGSNEYIEVLEEEGCLHIPEFGQVIFNKIRILEFGKVVMMTIVMFHIPSFWHHPIKPISEPTPERSNGELESMPAFLIGVHPIISTVTGMVGDHGPSGEGPGGQGNNGDKVDAHSHGKHSHGGTHVGPSDDFIEVADIIFSLLLFESFSQFLDFFGERFDIKGWNPFVSLLELFCFRFGLGRLAHCLVGRCSNGYSNEVVID